ncbi:MAG: CoA pyrophosphatase, partial [Bacteroidota bacterium]
MDFIHLKSMESLPAFLRSALSQPLPGQLAQEIMMPTLTDKSRFSIEKKKNARNGAVMILFYLKNNSWYFPLIQRPDYDGVHAKQMSFPGGKMDEEDKNLEETALRETHEEIGVPHHNVETIGELTDLYVVASNYLVLPIVAVLDSPPQFVKDPYEVDEIIEVKLTDLMDERNNKSMDMKIMQGITIHSPYFDLNQKV